MLEGHQLGKLFADPFAGNLFCIPPRHMMHPDFAKTAAHAFDQPDHVVVLWSGIEHMINQALEDQLIS